MAEEEYTHKVAKIKLDYDKEVGIIERASSEYSVAQRQYEERISGIDDREKEYNKLLTQIASIEKEIEKLEREVDKLLKM